MKAKATNNGTHKSTANFAVIEKSRKMFIFAPHIQQKASTEVLAKSGVNKHKSRWV